MGTTAPLQIKRIVEQEDGKSSYADRIAALTILIRLRHQLDEVEAHCREFVLYEYVISLLRALLMARPEFEEVGLADEIFKIFVDRIFSLTVEDQGLQFMLDNDPYAETSKVLLKQVVDHISRTNSRISYSKILVHILDGTLPTSVTRTYMLLIGRML